MFASVMTAVLGMTVLLAAWLAIQVAVATSKRPWRAAKIHSTVGLVATVVNCPRQRAICVADETFR